MYEHVVAALLRTDNTQNRLVLDVRGTAQTVAHHAYIVEFKSIATEKMEERVAFRILVQTRILSGVVTCMLQPGFTCTGSSSPKDRCGCRAP